MLLLQIEWAFLIEKIALITIILLISFGVAAYATWGERKVAAVMQDRLGPNRAGFMGLFQPLADGLKLFFKEEIIPDRSTRLIFMLGPCLFMVTALMTSAVIPWAPDLVTRSGHRISFQVADVNIGILFVFGVVSVGVYGIMLGGWSSNNKYSLLSSIRSASQSISYELAMGISLIALLMMTER
jgi:NADH-quinone oxidoreductase subunit H